MAYLMYRLFHGPHFREFPVRPESVKLLPQPCQGNDCTAVHYIGFRALIAATLATLMTAAVAGTFFTDSSILLGK